MTKDTALETSPSVTRSDLVRACRRFPSTLFEALGRERTEGLLGQTGKDGGAELFLTPVGDVLIPGSGAILPHRDITPAELWGVVSRPWGEYMKDIGGEVDLTPAKISLEFEEGPVGADVGVEDRLAVYSAEPERAIDPHNITDDQLGVARAKISEALLRGYSDGQTPAQGVTIGR